MSQPKEHKDHKDHHKDHKEHTLLHGIHLHGKSEEPPKTPTALVFLAEGAEEMETVIIMDVLRRAGIETTLAGLTGSDPVKCSRNVRIFPDMSLEEALTKGPFDILVLPGGPVGAKHLAECPIVGKALKDQELNKRLIAAVCAGPTALLSHGIHKGKFLTSYPTLAEKLKEGGYKYKEERVVQDGRLITSRGPGTTSEFALKIVENLCGKDKAYTLMYPMLLKFGH